jgi:uncharacterized protein (TIGR03083 family)
VSQVRELKDALGASHQRLVDAAGSMTAEQLVGASYCTDWTIAQALSHIGSGAQIFAVLLESALSGSEPPGREAFSKIWDVWNAMTPEEQGRTSLTADAAFLERVNSIPDEQLEGLRMTLFGQPADAARLLGMRLAEHAVHTWDVVVMGDPAAPIADDAVLLIVDRLDQVATHSGRTDAGPLEVEVVTSDPARMLRLSVQDTVTLSEAGDSPAAATLRLPAEALVRLVYGRLDPVHTPPAVAADGVDLDTLRSVFPGV